MGPSLALPGSCSLPSFSAVAAHGRVATIAAPCEKATAGARALVVCSIGRLPGLLKLSVNVRRAHAHVEGVSCLASGGRQSASGVVDGPALAGGGLAWR